MTVSVPEIKLSSDISDFIAYPNPSDGKINLEFSVRTKGNVKLELFDSSGKLIAIVFNSNVNAGQKKTVTVNLSDYASSAFFCRISKDNFSKTLRLVSGY